MKKNIFITEAFEPYNSKYLTSIDQSAKDLYNKKLKDDKVVDIESFHKGYDKELYDLGALDKFDGRYYIFDSEGKIGRSSYGNVKKVCEANKGNEAATALMNLWVAIHGKYNQIPYESDALAAKAEKERIRKEKEAADVRRKQQDEKLKNINDTLRKNLSDLQDKLQGIIDSSLSIDEIRQIMGPDACEVWLSTLLDNYEKKVYIKGKFTENKISSKEDYSSPFKQPLFKISLSVDDDPNDITAEVLYDSSQDSISKCFDRALEIKDELKKDAEVEEFLSRQELSHIPDIKDIDGTCHFIYLWHTEYYSIRVGFINGGHNRTLVITEPLKNKYDKSDKTYYDLKDDMELAAIEKVIKDVKDDRPGRGDYDLRATWSYDSDKLSDDFLRKNDMLEHSGNMVAGTSYEELSGVNARRRGSFYFGNGFDSWGIYESWSFTSGD